MKKRKRMKKRFAALAMAVILAWTTVDMPIVAAENPQCTCAEKCTEDTLNIWCDVCGKQGVSACQGTDTAVTYDAATPDFSAAKVLTAVDGALYIDGVALTINTDQFGDFNVIIPEGNYKLTGNIATDNIYIHTEGSINLDLNGYTWDMSGKYLFINGNVTLSLYDTSVNKTGKITTSSRVYTIYLSGSGSTFNLYSGTVENTSNEVNAYGVSSYYGSSNLYGGTIKSNSYAVSYNLKSEITINIDNTSFDCGDGYAQIKTSFSSDGEPCAVIDVSDYTGGALTVDAKIDKAGKIKIFTGIQSTQDPENYKINFSCDDDYDFFEEKQEYEADGGNKYVYVSVPSFTTQPTRENGYYTVAFNHPDATLQWCEATVYDSATYSEEDGDHPTSYGVKAGDTLIVSLSECSDDFYVFFDCRYNEELLVMFLDSSRKTASVTFDSEGTVDVNCMPSPYGTGEYKMEHVRYTELEGENGVQLSKTECETTYACKATVGEREYYSDEVTIEHSCTCNATSDNVITKECANCGKSGTLTITAEDGIYDGTTAYGATVEKTGIFENEEVIVNYYKGNTSIGTGAPVDAGTYTAKITYEDDVTASYQFTIEKADSVITAAPTPIADLVYDGTAQNLINAGTATGGTMQYSLDGTNYSPTIPTGTDAGDYTVWYKVGGDENHGDTTPESVKVTIAPKPVVIDTVTASDRVFDGTDKVEISEVIIEGILVEDEDKVSVSATAAIDSINAGEYIIVDLSNIALTGSANYSIAASVENVPLTTAVTISKADAPTLPSGSKAYVYSIGYEGESVSITGLPTNCGEVEYSLLSVSSDMFENLSVDSRSGKITYDVKALDNYTEDLQGTISVNVMMENYKTAIYTLTITRTEKIPQNISAEDITLTYGDADATISVTGAKTGLTYEVISDSNDNGDVVTVDANGKVSIENAGTAIIKITAVASDTYAESECEIRVTVNKRPVNIKAESYTVKKGDTLPTFYYDVTGLVNNETLPITVSIACTASDTNTVGTYDITVSGVSSEGNYTYVYTNGVLEVLAEDEAPFIMGDDGKMGWDAISDEIEDANKGDTIVVDMNGATVVLGDIIEEARDKGITISFVLDNGLTWTIDGSTVTDGDISNINFDTTVEDENNPLNNIPVDVINGVTGEKATIEVNLTYSGNFGFAAVLKANLGSDNAGYYANLYYYNPTTGKLEYMCADVIASNGEAELTFTHASDYLIVIDDEDLGKAPDDDADDDDADDNDDDDDNTTEDKDDGKDEVPNTGDDNDDDSTTEDKDDGKDEVPDTGDDGTLYLWVLMLCALIGMAGVTYYEKLLGKKE